MNELTPIIKLGNPILRQKAAAVENVQSQEIQNLIDELITSVSQANGVGIAAPQIASSYRLFPVLLLDIHTHQKCSRPQ
jgi:peptide deformylase